MAMYPDCESFEIRSTVLYGHQKVLELRAWAMKPGDGTRRSEHARSQFIAGEQQIARPGSVPREQALRRALFSVHGESSIKLAFR